MQPVDQLLEAGPEALLRNPPGVVAADPETGVLYVPSITRSSGGALSLSRGDSTYRVMVNWLTGSVLISAGAEPVGLPS